jgi:hypothetical protein
VLFFCRVSYVVHSMIHRYLHRDGRSASEVEGIYSVSCIITKSKRHWLTGNDMVRVVERKDNYARVAIMKETLNLKRDFIEVSMSFKDATKYPIVGDLAVLADGSGYVYKHVEPDGEIIYFSMLLTHADLLEGQFSRSKRNKIITTRLSYFKLYPKISKDNVVSNWDR